MTAARNPNCQGCDDEQNSRRQFHSGNARRVGVGGLIRFLQYFRAWGESDEPRHGRGPVHLATVIERSVLPMTFYFAMLVRGRCNGTVVLGNILLVEVPSM